MDKYELSYELEADVLTWELTNKPIDCAEQIKNFIFHFTKDNELVLIEILEAKKFIKELQKIIKHG